MLIREMWQRRQDCVAPCHNQTLKPALKRLVATRKDKAVAEPSQVEPLQMQNPSRIVPNSTSSCVQIDSIQLKGYASRPLVVCFGDNSPAGRPEYAALPHRRMFTVAAGPIVTTYLADDLGAKMKFAVEPTLSLTQAGIKSGSRVSAKDMPQPLGGALKRAFDIVLAGAAIILLSPLLIGLAFLVQCSSPGPILYGHSRVGFGGKTFKCWKFRSMVMNGDAVLANHLRQNAAAQSEWSESQKLRDDPRVTAVGQILRKLSLDVLPQLFNIFLGDMSIVGPRPIVMDEVRRYGPSVRHYLRTRPGLTGLWQISGRSDVGYRQRVLLDRVYVQKWSSLKDIGIILRTVPVVLRSRGSY